MTLRAWAELLRFRCCSVAAISIYKPTRFCWRTPTAGTRLCPTAKCPRAGGGGFVAARNDYSLTYLTGSFAVRSAETCPAIAARGSEAPEPVESLLGQTLGNHPRDAGFHLSANSKRKLSAVIISSSDRARRCRNAGPSKRAIGDRPNLRARLDAEQSVILTRKFSQRWTT